MPPLTPRQTAILDFIRAYIDRCKFPPSIREIGEHFGISSPTGVICHIRVLERRGMISRVPGKARAIIVTA